MLQSLNLLLKQGLSPSLSPSRPLDVGPPAGPFVDPRYIRNLQQIAGVLPASWRVCAVQVSGPRSQVPPAPAPQNLNGALLGKCATLLLLTTSSQPATPLVRNGTHLATQSKSWHRRLRRRAPPPRPCCTIGWLELRRRREAPR